MKQIPTIETVMTPLVYSIEIDAEVVVAEQRMFDYEIRHLAVTEDGALVGVISDRDIAFSPSDTEQAMHSQLSVREICSLDVYAVGHDEPLDRVLLELADRHLGAVLVTRNGEMAGIFTTTDACRRFADLLHAG